MLSWRSRTLHSPAHPQVGLVSHACAVAHLLKLCLLLVRQVTSLRRVRPDALIDKTIEASGFVVQVALVAWQAAQLLFASPARFGSPAGSYNQIEKDQELMKATHQPSRLITLMSPHLPIHGDSLQEDSQQGISPTCSFYSDPKNILEFLGASGSSPVTRGTSFPRCIHSRCIEKVINSVDVDV